ncbi:recombination regulator RecX [Clostridium paraputrificum]|uniref:recombination regulator RecX n=1 Tax=Clostridium TaxID=1485 RepID=UPI003D343240
MGKITKIEVQKRNKDRVNVYIDEVYAFAVNAELVYKKGLKTNMEIDEVKLKEVAKEENLSKCKNTALRIIERSYKTEKEITDKLIEKGYDMDSIKPTLEFLKEYNFINDESYTKMYVKDRMRSQGSQKIKYALMRKGVEEEAIASALENIDKEDEMQVAMELARKKYSQLSKREDDKYKLWNKLCRFLIGKGYDYSLAKDVVKKVVNVEDVD